MSTKLVAIVLHIYIYQIIMPYALNEHNVYANYTSIKPWGKGGREERRERWSQRV